MPTQTFRWLEANRHLLTAHALHCVVEDLTVAEWIDSFGDQDLSFHRWARPRLVEELGEPSRADLQKVVEELRSLEHSDDWSLLTRAWAHACFVLIPES